ITPGGLHAMARDGPRAGHAGLPRAVVLRLAGGHRPDRDRHARLAETRLAPDIEWHRGQQRHTRHRRRPLWPMLDVGQHGPGLLPRRVNGDAPFDTHAILLPAVRGPRIASRRLSARVSSHTTVVAHTLA